MNADTRPAFRRLSKERPLHSRRGRGIDVNGGIVSEAAERTNREQVTESGFHAAVSSQLRIPSLTPSHPLRPLEVVLTVTLTEFYFYPAQPRPGRDSAGGASGGSSRG
jgi:hypothetical protein